MLPAPSLPSSDPRDAAAQRACLAARDGLPRLLYLLLRAQPPDLLPRLLNQPVEVDGVSCTPLVAAARHGQEDAIRILLEKFSPIVDIEAEATVRFEEYVINGATALWAAAGAGHLKVVKRLTRAGAKLDHATTSASTPLRAACFDGRLDIVRYLVERGADLHLPNQYNNTCLMIAAYKGHLDIVTYLLDRGARVEERAQCGATALHFAAECGHVAVVRELLDYGAELVPNENGMTALICAAERTRSAVVEMLVERPEVTHDKAVEAMELLGASFANDKEYYCLPMAYQFLKRSMEMRLGNDEYPPMPREPAPPIPAYDNWRECSTLEELMAIRDDPTALHMEGLAIRERILGRACPELPHPIVFRGAVFADDARFDRCLSLWWHALYLRQENNVPVFKDLLRFAQVFSQMLHIGIEVPFAQVVMILDACSVELNRNREKIEKPAPKEEFESLYDEYETNIRTGLYLITIVATLLDPGKNVRYNRNYISCPEKVKQAKYAVHRVVQPEPRIRDKQTLLHLALNPNMPVDDFHTNDVCKFPCLLTCQLLLQCGADPNAQDMRRDTPLHYLTRNSVGVCTVELPIDEYSQILNSLVAYGAHVDIVNCIGLTPIDLSQPGPVEALLRKIWQGRLACLAAKVISRHGLSYRGYVPTHLNSFIQLHGHMG